VVWGLLCRVAGLGVAYYFLEPARPGSGATKRLALAGGGFLAVSGAPWLALPPQPPGVEQALSTETRMLWYGGLMVAGALVAVLAGLAHRRTSGRHTAVRALATAAPLALLAVPVLLAPANPVTSDVPAALAAAYRWTGVFGQLTMWAAIGGVHAWLGDPELATEEIDYAATAD
jgi:predicted cobalt transporter CbtA